MKCISIKGRYFVAHIEKSCAADETLKNKIEFDGKRERDRERRATIGKMYSAIAYALVVLYKHEAAVGLLRTTNFFFLRNSESRLTNKPFIQLNCLLYCGVFSIFYHYYLLLDIGWGYR